MLTNRRISLWYLDGTSIDMRFIKTVMREIHHSYILTADVSLRTATTIPLQLLFPATWSTTNISIVRVIAWLLSLPPFVWSELKAQPEGNTGECAGGGKCATEGWRASCVALRHNAESPFTGQASSANSAYWTNKSSYLSWLWSQLIPIFSFLLYPAHRFSVTMQPVASSY